MNEEEQGIISEPDNTNKTENDSNENNKGSWSIFITIYKKIFHK